MDFSNFFQGSFQLFSSYKTKQWYKSPQRLAQPAIWRPQGLRSEPRWIWAYQSLEIQANTVDDNQKSGEKTTWDGAKTFVNNGIKYQPQLVITTWDGAKTFVNNGIKYRPQLVNAGFLKHQQYCQKMMAVSNHLLSIVFWVHHYF